MISETSKNIKQWAVTLLLVALLLLVAKTTVYNFIIQYTSTLGVWINNYFANLIILVISIPLIKWLVGNWIK